jgi:hypothetical protein
MAASQDRATSVTDVFISYAREDRKFVQLLHDALANAGRESWVDWEGIPASAKWMAEVGPPSTRPTASVSWSRPTRSSPPSLGEEILATTRFG